MCKKEQGYYQTQEDLFNTPREKVGESLNKIKNRYGSTITKHKCKWSKRK